MALFEDKPMSTCNHVSWTLADGGKVVCDGCGLACGLTMELASKPTPKWEEELVEHDRRWSEGKGIIGLKDFIREKLREMYDDVRRYSGTFDQVREKWGL